MEPLLGHLCEICGVAHAPAPAHEYHYTNLDHLPKACIDSITMTPLDDPVALRCACRRALFSRTSIAASVARDPRCPVCRTAVAHKDIVDVDNPDLIAILDGLEVGVVNL